MPRISSSRRRPIAAAAALLALLTLALALRTTAAEAFPDAAAALGSRPAGTPVWSRMVTSLDSTLAALRLPWRCRAVSRAICLNKRTRALYYVRYGVTQRTYAARFGRPSQPTRNGTFSVYWKDRWHWSSLYGSAMPFSLFFSGGQAIHYSANFAAVGYAGSSHGCVNLRSWYGAKWVYEHTPVGTRVYVGWW